MGKLYVQLQSNHPMILFSPVFFLGHNLVTAGGVTEATPLGPAPLLLLVRQHRGYDRQGGNSIEFQTFQWTFQRSFDSSVGHPVVHVLETLLKSLLRFN